MSLADALQFIWPTLVSAAAWAIAIRALREPDTHSELVRRLVGDSAQVPTTKQAKIYDNQP